MKIYRIDSEEVIRRRERKGISQAGLARMIINPKTGRPYHRSTLNQLELGVYEGSEDIAKALAVALGCTVPELLVRKEEQKVTSKRKNRSVSETGSSDRH